MADIAENTTPPSNPAIRLLARFIDFYVATVFTWLFAGITFNYSLPTSVILQIMIISFTWIFIESILLSTFGTTPGKFLLNIKISEGTRRILTFPTALKRSFLVWVIGLGLGLPIASVFTLFFANKNLIDNGITVWDKECKLQVTHKPIGFFRGIIAVAATAIVIVIFFIGIVANH